MTHTITVSSRIFSSDDLQSLRTDFKLPLTEFRSISPVQLPAVLNFNIEQGVTQDVDMTVFGSKLRMIAVKSTRPVSLVMTAGSDTYSFPLSTFIHYLVDSAEDATVAVESMAITVPPEPVTVPSTRPAGYPNARVEMFVLFE